MEGAVWGTSYHISYMCAENLSDSIIALMNEINESLSMFSPTSTVSHVNSGETDSVDDHFINVYNVARKVNAVSDGAFDPTVAPLVDLWGFGRNGRDTMFPDSTDVASALEKVGISRCSVAGQRIIKGHPEMEFDFSAIAKGYGVECIAEMLKRNACNDFMVEIGGEIQLAGYNPHGNIWHIQVDVPEPGLEPGDSALMILEITDCAIATSGNYRNYRKTTTDSIISHTINPVTGYPAPCHMLSATVIAHGCTEADALATALMASPAENASKIMQHFPMSKAIIVLPSGRTIIVEPN